MSSPNGESSQGAYKYDPDQDPDEKRRIRDGYRNQLRELEGRPPSLIRASCEADVTPLMDFLNS